MAGGAGHESWIERQIREATERGEFDGLPGAGRPLRGLDDPDPDWWVRRKLAAEGLDAGDALPPALQLRREAASYPEALVDVRSEADVRELLRDYNHRVLEERRRPSFGRAAPVLAPTIDVDDMVEHWRALRAARAAVDPPAPAAAPGPGRSRWWTRLRRPGRSR